MTRSASSPTMIGRDADLDGLRRVLADTLEGHPRGVVVGGEAGIGKTRLLREFMAEAAGSALVVSGWCVDLGDGGPPFGPVTGVLRGLVAAVGLEELQRAAGPGKDALSTVLPEIGPLRSSTGGDLNRLHEAVTTALETLSCVTPVVVVVEDVQWANDATLKVLQFLLRRLDGARVMVVLSYRTDDVSRGHPLRSFLAGLERSQRIVRVDLGRLARDEVRDLVTAIVGSEPAVPVLDRLVERSDGVPFFVEELLGLEETCNGVALPDTLRELLLARYERLTEPTQQALRLISVGGDRVPHDLLVSVFPGSAEQLEAAAREAVSAHVLVVDDETYAFRHALVREAVSSDLLPGERARFHTRYAEEYERRAPHARVATRVAHHWQAAHNIARAFPATLDAMAEAVAACAFRTAAQLGERALELWDLVPDPADVAQRTRSDLLAQTAAALRDAGDVERALAMIELAIGSCPGEDAVHRAELLREKAHYLANIGRRGSIPLLEEALGLLPDGPVGPVRAKVLSSLAVRFLIEARIPEAITVARRALDEALAVGSDRYASVAANMLGLCRIQSGEIEAGMADLESARHLARGDHSALLRYLVNASDLMQLLGRYEEALQIAEEGIVAARAQGVERTSGVILASNAVDPLLALGQWDRADELVGQMLTSEAPLAYRLYLQRSRIWSVLWRGDAAEAERLFRGWRSSMTALGDVEMQARLVVARLVGEIAVARGDLDEAWQQVEVLLSGSRGLPGHDLPLLALGARVLGAWRRSAAAAPDQDVLADRERRLRAWLESDAFWPTAPVWTALVDAELSGPARDGGDVGAWLRATEAMTAPTAQAHLRPYAMLRLAEAQLAAGDRPAATRSLRAALADADRIGAGLVRQWAVEVADRAGLVVEDRRVALAPDGSPLTARELQVLELIGQGLSNRQIGERLFISGKTASVHVSAILRKLGAASRTEAVYRARVLSGAGTAPPR